MLSTSNEFLGHTTASTPVDAITVSVQADSRWDAACASIAPLREALLLHPVYARIADLQNVRVFMEAHVFAVWDFMSLLKELQRQICCVSVPWVPPRDPALARLINEIVLAEETDETEDGNYASHFDLYLAAMEQAGANTVPITRFIEMLRTGATVSEALDQAGIPAGPRRFVEQTFSVIETGHLPSIAAAFTFGREDLLPDVFTCVIDGISQQSAGRLSRFVYYLDRHVSLDGDEHGPMARRLVTHLCGHNSDHWQRVTETIDVALTSRLELWDWMLSEID